MSKAVSYVSMSRETERMFRDAATGEASSWADIEDYDADGMILDARKAHKDFRTQRKVARRSREFTFDDSSTRRYADTANRPLGLEEVMMGRLRDIAGFAL